jgi:hypothetical protein
MPPMHVSVDRDGAEAHLVHRAPRRASKQSLVVPKHGRVRQDLAVALGPKHAHDSGAPIDQGHHLAPLAQPHHDADGVVEQPVEALCHADQRERLGTSNRDLPETEQLRHRGLPALVARATARER